MDSYEVNVEVIKLKELHMEVVKRTVSIHDGLLVSISSS